MAHQKKIRSSQRLKGISMTKERQKPYHPDNEETHGFTELSISFPLPPTLNFFLQKGKTPRNFLFLPETEILKNVFVVFQQKNMFLSALVQIVKRLVWREQPRTNREEQERQTCLDQYVPPVVRAIVQMYARQTRFEFCASAALPFAPVHILRKRSLQCVTVGKDTVFHLTTDGRLFNLDTEEEDLHFPLSHACSDVQLRSEGDRLLCMSFYEVWKSSLLPDGRLTPWEGVHTIRSCTTFISNRNVLRCSATVQVETFSFRTTPVLLRKLTAGSMCVAPKCSFSAPEVPSPGVYYAVPQFSPSALCLPICS